MPSLATPEALEKGAALLGPTHPSQTQDARHNASPGLKPQEPQDWGSEQHGRAAGAAVTSTERMGPAGSGVEQAENGFPSRGAAPGAWG